MNLRPIQRLADAMTPLLCGLLLAALLPGSFALAAPTTETRDVGAFEQIDVSGSMDLIVRQGPQTSVQVQADDKLLPLVETVVENGAKGARLKLRWKPAEGQFWRWSNGPQGDAKVLVTVTTPRLTAVTSSGSGNTRIEAFKTPSMQLAVAGSGEARFDALATEELSVRVSGSGDVSGTGSAGRLKISVAGSGDVRLPEMRADEVSVSIAGSGNAAVAAQRTLDVSIAGSGNVSYTGDAQVKSSVAGSGSVRRR
jgi:carbon monoxide dehydrogenase subunit G